MKDRETRILSLLGETGRMEVAELARRLDVSAVTVRKDLDDLERHGVIRREHGCAIFGGTDDMNNRLAFHYEEKRRIAAEAAKLITPDETVMIESGSCCALLAEEIARTLPGTTIITNSAFIAAYIRRFPFSRVVLLGGDLQNDAQVLVGPLLRQCARSFFVDKLFIGVDGWREDTGFMGNDHLRACAVRDMAAQAEGVIVLTESEKFGRTGTVPLSLPREVRGVITDPGITPGTADLLSRRGIFVRSAGEN